MASLQALHLDDILNILNDAGNAGDDQVEEGAGGLGPGGQPEPAANPARPNRARAARRRLGRGLRQRQAGNQKRKTSARRRASLVDLQISRFNESGRSRNQDFHFPSQGGGLKRKSTKGKGQWKKWSPEAILRAGFSSEMSSRRDMGAAVDGAGVAHAGRCRFVVAKSIARGQELGTERVCNEGCEILVRNIMFDESSLDLSSSGKAKESSSLSWSVLCSHGQWTYKLRGADTVQDQHIIRSPQILVPVMNSVTMHEALSKDPGGFHSTCQDSDRIATITTCDAHAANLRMLRFWEQQLPQNHLFLPNLCIQHRTGNVIEQLTKLLGNLGGNFSVAKVLNKANLLRGLRKRISAKVEKDFAVISRVPAAVQEEWAAGKRQAKQLVDLCLSFDEDSPEPARPGSVREAFNHLLEFFDGPWTGPNAGSRE